MDQKLRYFTVCKSASNVKDNDSGRRDSTTMREVVDTLYINAREPVDINAVVGVVVDQNSKGGQLRIRIMGPDIDGEWSQLGGVPELRFHLPNEPGPANILVAIPQFDIPGMSGKFSAVLDDPNGIVGPPSAVLSSFNFGIALTDYPSSSDSSSTEV